MQVTGLPQQIKSWFKSLSEEPEITQTTMRCCLYMTSQEITIIQIDKKNNHIEISLNDVLHFGTRENLPLVLAGLADKYNLQEIPTYLLLTTEDYQIFLIESLRVEADEFKDALNWRIKSLITYPIEDVIIEYFMFPPKKTSSIPMVAAIMSIKKFLAEIVMTLENAGIHLTTIDIPEMAMRNLTAPYENDEKSTAFIYLEENIAILNITQQKKLYFTRHINLATDKQSTTNEYEQLALDLLRYFDYFQSQWRFPSPNRILIASGKKDMSVVAKSLSQYLSLSVEPFTLKNIKVDQTKLQLLETKYLLPLGCALREEDAHATPGN